MTLSLGYEPDELNTSVYDLFQENPPSATEVVQIADNRPNLGILPAETALASLDTELAGAILEGEGDYQTPSQNRD